MKEQTTICAVSTAPGTGGIATVRVSGPEATAIVDKIYTPVRREKSVSQQEPYTITRGQIVCRGEIVDEVLVAVFRAPHSFTGEDTVEITCHGSLYIQQRLLQLLLHEGAVAAKAGEFTQRAFLNGKIDLSQAEAVADLIASTSASSHRLAMSQMRGNFSRELQDLRRQLLDFVSLIELELDFGEEHRAFADRSRLKAVAATIDQLIKRLLRSFAVGNAVKNGIPVVIIGETNCGKSTLLNLLLQDEKAIVSDVHGTTRDAIEDTIDIQGVTFRFIDTAGIRETADEIEMLGIERTFKKIAQASIVLWMIDSTQVSDKVDKIAARIIRATKNKKLLLVFNKTDRISWEEQLVLEQLFSDMTAGRVYISAKYNHNLPALEQLILRAARLPEIGQDDVIVTNIRHYEALSLAAAALERVMEGLATEISGDFLSQDLRECVHHLGEITGEITTDEVLGNIFRNFCIGK
jgi:tRNA modification GTPase